MASSYSPSWNSISLTVAPARHKVAIELLPLPGALQSQNAINMPFTLYTAFINDASFINHEHNEKEYMKS